MRDLTLLDDFRLRTQWVLENFGSYGDDKNGAFRLPMPGQTTLLRVVAASGEGWDHISVSLPNRTPTWAEMDHAKRRFFKDDELAWEYHMPPNEHISIHPYTLHIWRKHGFTMPLPPKWFV
jgi:hypothetical protein